MPGYENELGMQCNTLLRSFVISGLPAKWTVKRFETSGLSSELEKREELVLSSIGFLSNESRRKKVKLDGEKNEGTTSWWGSKWKQYSARSKFGKRVPARLLARTYRRPGDDSSSN
ncbi:hypothetical protein V1478_016640 [Vespula squamosa]|uniref:Uncharacterized protein n=1 Tax=Vespula squamosa TaxID=30214 RepID=A0ABD2A0F0_VESSQ